MSEPQKPQLPATPMLDLIGKYQSRLRALQAFLEWWNDQPRDEYGRPCPSCGRNDHLTFSIRPVMEQFARDEYGIDSEQVEQERVALLAYQRALNDWYARRVPVLYELDEHDEATGTVLFFCSPQCRELGQEVVAERHREGGTPLRSLIGGTVCWWCWRQITEHCPLISPEEPRHES